jgi:hypothetical protein
MILFLLENYKKLLKVSLINDYTKNLYVIEEISIKILYYIKENMMKKDEKYFYGIEII